MFVILCLSILAFHSTLAANVLVIPGHSSASHTKGMYPLADAMASRGHHVLMLQLVKFEEHKAKAPSKSKMRDRYVLIPPKPEELAQPMRIPKEVMWSKMMLGGVSFMFPWKATTEVCKRVLDSAELHKEFMDILRATKWDLVIVDDIFTPCGYLAAAEARKLWNATTIDFGTSILIPQSQEVRGLPLNEALYPSALQTQGYYDHENFWQRLLNAVDFASFYLVETALDHLVPFWLGLPRTASTAPSLFSLDSDLLMSSFSPILEFTKPMSRDIIELDADCPTPTALPANYQQFVEDPESKGTIVFAMGHTTDWDEVPDGLFESFLGAFANLSDYRVIWQYVSKKAKPRVPSHIMLDKWVPQAGLLYHPRTKVFISHVGGKSLRETICARVPVVTMPLFAEQYRNAAAAKRKKISVFLDKTALSPEIIYSALTEILDDVRYKDNIVTLQNVLEDQILKPMELGHFWAEFLTRHSSVTVRKYFRMRMPELFFFSVGCYDLGVFSMVLVFGLLKIVC